MDKVKVLYISPSTLPSRTANAVHVVHQCEGFSQNGVRTELVARRSSGRRNSVRTEVLQAYNVTFTNVTLNTVRFWNRGSITALALLGFMRARALRQAHPLIVSRNLYASYALARAAIPHFYETHQLGMGPAKPLEKYVLGRRFIRPVVISSILKSLLEEHHELLLGNALILHDAAPSGVIKLSPDQRRVARSDLLAQVGLPPANFVAGYFGHLYPGRGLEIIEAMSAAHPDVPFLVFGGNEADLVRLRNRPHPINLHYRGYIPHAEAQATMLTCDVLLMPYQRSVSIGVPRQDTARWMSPMKMFEYMATGNAILSSDLPVINEVLQNERNALMIAPTDASAWIEALSRVKADHPLRAAIGTAAHEDYRSHYTWERRASAFLSAFKN